METNEEIIPIQEICRIYNIKEVFIIGLSDSGLIQLFKRSELVYLLRDDLGLIEKYIHFHFELEINFPGLEALGNMIPKMESLQNEVRDLQNQIHFYESYFSKHFIELEN